MHRATARTRLRCAALVLAWVSVLAPPFAASQQTPHVLVIHSYHRGFTWTDQVHTGIERALEGRAVDLDVEYLDAKRHPAGVVFEEYAALLAAKSRGWSPNLIISMDDDALSFLFQYRDELYPGTPVVFGGLNVDDYDPALLEGRFGYTGVVERLDLAGTVEVILEVQPRVQTIAFVHDRTTSGLADRATIERIVQRYPESVDFVFPDSGSGLTCRELFSWLPSLPSAAAVYFLSFFRDSAGRSFAPEDIVRRISAVSPVPVYSHVDSHLGKGILGGKLLSGEEHGYSTGMLAAKILDGQSVEDVPVAVESSNRLVFDYRQLRRFGISQSRLPPGSIVRFAPESFFERHRRPILLGVGGVVLLICLTVALGVLVVRLRRAELRLGRSEAEYRAMFEENRAVKLLVDPDSATILEANPAAAAYYGFSVEELCGKSLYDIQSEGQVCSLLAKALDRDIERLDARHRRASGEERDVELYPSVIHTEDGTRVYAIIHDVTARKAAETRQEMLLQELNHRVKNNLAIVASLIDMKSNEVGDAVDLTDLSHRIDAVRIIHEKLSESGDVEYVNLESYLQDVVTTVVSSFAEPPVDTVYDLAPIRCGTKTAVTVGLIVNELATNSVKHAFPHSVEPKFRIVARPESGMCRIEVSNSGPPLDPGFDIDRAPSMGMRLIRGLVGQLRGSFEISGDEHPTFTVEFPADSEQPCDNRRDRFS